MALAVFCVSVFLIAYTLFIYPFLIYFLSRFGRPVEQDRLYVPSISVLVPVYNEEKVLREKIDNCLALDYPADRLEIVFASDGSTDRSVEILHASENGRLSVLEYPTNRGKAAVLNESIPRLKGDIVVLSDASGLLPETVLRVIGSIFHDSKVGCVCGIYDILKEGRTSVDSAESSYQGFEMRLRLWEGRVWSTLSGTGALLSVRRTDYQPLPSGAINEDFIIPARIALQGKRVVYDQRIHVFDRIFTTLSEVYRRRVRIAYGNWQQLAYLKPLMSARHGYLAWVFYSHKLLRMAIPYLLVAMLATSYALSPWVCMALVGAFVGLLLLGMFGVVLDRFVRGHNPLAFITLVFFNCLAVFVGTFRYAIGSQVRW